MSIRPPPAAPLLLALLAGPVGCTPELEIAHVQAFCTNYDFDTPQESEVLAEVRADVIYVYRTYALEPAGSEFDPRVTNDGRTLHVYEGWTASDEEDELCYQPGLEIQGLKGGLEVRWYIDDSGVPYRTIEVEAQ